MDDIKLNLNATIGIQANGGFASVFLSPLAGDNLLCGTFPGSEEPY